MFDFPKKYRLVSKQDFQFVFAEPFKIKHKNLIALYRSNNLSHARIGIIISKHHVKNAIDRNRIRRILRESFRHQKELMKGLDIIVLLRSECTPLNKQSLRDDVDQLWLTIATSLKKF